MAAGIPQLKPIQTPSSLKEMAFAAIKEAIMTDRLRSGILYSEPTLAKELGISRTPVHEALNMLSSRGFLKLLPRRGFQINKFHEEDIHNLYSFRIALETAVMQEITPGITDRESREMEAISVKQGLSAKKGSWMNFLKFDRELHYFFASLTNNKFIIDALENVRDLIDWTGVKILAERKERPREAVNEHNSIIDNLKKRDVDGTVSMMERHLRISEERVIGFIARSKG